MQKYKIQKCNRGYEILKRVESNKSWQVWKYLKIYFPTKQQAQEGIENHG